MCKCMHRKKSNIKNYSNIRQSFVYMYIFILHITDTHIHNEHIKTCALYTFT